MRQQHHEAALSDPLVLPTADELVDNALQGTKSWRTRRQLSMRFLNALVSLPLRDSSRANTRWNDQTTNRAWFTKSVVTLCHFSATQSATLTNVLFIWVNYEKPSSPYSVTYYYWWGCRGNLTLITLGSERVALIALYHVQQALIRLPERCCWSNVPCSLTSNNTSHCMENSAFHSLLR